MANQSTTNALNKSIVLQFNQAINTRDLALLESLMTDDHLFVDSGHNLVKGRIRCVKAWKGFFKRFPDYRNHFENLEVRKEVVMIQGYSHCSDKRLQGPAQWKAEIRENKIALWQVYELPAESIPTN